MTKLLILAISTLAIGSTLLANEVSGDKASRLIDALNGVGAYTRGSIKLGHGNKTASEIKCRWVLSPKRTSCSLVDKNESPDGSFPTEGVAKTARGDEARALYRALETAGVRPVIRVDVGSLEVSSVECNWKWAGLKVVDERCEITE